MDETATSPGPSWGARLVLGAQCAVLVGYLIGAFGVLITAAVKTGDYSGVLDPGVHRYGDPKGSIPPVGPDSIWNPLGWLFGLCVLVALLAYPLAFAGVLLGLGYLALPRERDLRASGRILAGSIGCLALMVFASTRYGERLATWLID